jgi:hypothetical protein
MKTLIIVFALTSAPLWALGDRGPLPSSADSMGSTVGTLNQVSKEQDEPPVAEPQDQQEIQYQKDLELEKKIEEERFDEKQREKK